MENAEKKIGFAGIKPFEFHIHCYELDSHSPLNTHHQHLHEECEIYINLSGNISFMCEDTIYPVQSGNVIINAPYERHHCIYHSNALHKFYWILFSRFGNEHLFDLFFKRPRGCNNRIVLPERNTAELVRICERLLKNETSEFDRTLDFFSMIKLLEGGDTDFFDAETPEAIKSAIYHISGNLASDIDISELAKRLGFSLSGFERNFKKYVGMSPKRYVIQRRLSYAAELLVKGMNVTEACQACGFVDYSHFIARFRERFGVTPLKYQKQTGLN